MSQRNQHLTHTILRKPATTIPKQYDDLAKIGNMLFCSRAGDLQSVTMFSGILAFRWTFQGTDVVQAANSGKRVAAAISYNLLLGAINTLAFWTPRSGPPQLRYDSRRLRKKEQDAQDDVIKLFDLFHARFWCCTNILNPQRWSSPVQHMDVCVILPVFCGCIVSGAAMCMR